MSGQGQALTLSTPALTGAASNLLTAVTSAPGGVVSTILPADSIRIAPELPVAPAMCPPPDGTRPDPTLVNTDPFVLSRFPLERVYQQLISLAGVAQSPLQTRSRRSC